MTHGEMVAWLRGFVDAEYVDWEPSDSKNMAEIADELERLAQEQDVRAFEEVQNIGRELLATMKERDAWRERCERARCMIEQRASVHEYAIAAGEEMIAAALADEPPGRKP